MTDGRRIALAALAVFVAVVALYWPTLRGGFVYDSIAQVLYSDYLHTPSHWVDVLTLRVVGQDELDRNRPMHLASLMLDAAIWGRNPFGYRLTSVLLHALNAALLCVLIAIILARQKNLTSACVVLAALFGSFVFALHPLVVEAVAEPSNREDLLVLLPMLVGLLFIATQQKYSRSVLNAALILAGFFAVLGKESGAAVPLVFAVAAWLFGSFRRCWPGIVGGALAVIAFLAASYVWRPASSAIFANAPADLAGDFPSLLALQLRIWTLQLWQVLWPWQLSAHYTAASIAGISTPLGGVVVASALALSVGLWRAHRLAALGVAVYVLGLLPASNFAAQYHPIADRYLYVPLAGVGMIAAVLAGGALAWRWRSLAGWCAAGIFLILLCCEYAANLRRQFIWQEPAALWADVLRRDPRVSQALLGIANVRYRAGDYQGARAAAIEAVAASNGLWADAWGLRAICEWRSGSGDLAAESLRRAMRLSRVYESGESAEKAMIFSPEQLSALAELRRTLAAEVGSPR